MTSMTIGLDLSKTVFQVHGVDATGSAVLTKRLSRGKLLGLFADLAPSVVAMEACGSAHYWGRQLAALGHEVRLVPAVYVKPFVKRGKTDAADAAAICEAAQRPSMQFVPVKSEAQQAARALHRARELAVRQRTQTGNALRGLLAEFGVVAPQGAAGLRRLAQAIDSQDAPLPVPEAMLLVARTLLAQWHTLDATAARLEARIVAEAKADPRAGRLMAVPGIGPMTAHALLAAVPDPRAFRSGRAFAAWLGLTPRIHASGRRRRTGRITRMGDPGVRRLLVLGASARLRHARTKPDKAGPWLRGMLARRPVKVVAVAQAARTARIVWAMMARDEPYRPRAAA